MVAFADGVHPTPAFHRVIADKWLRCFENSKTDKKTRLMPRFL